VLLRPPPFPGADRLVALGPGGSFLVAHLLGARIDSVNAWDVSTYGAVVTTPLGHRHVRLLAACPPRRSAKR